MTGWERKPRILMLGDVVGWAWDNKIKELQKHLSDEFAIDNIPLQEKRGKGFSVTDYDLYVTFGWSTVRSLDGVPIERRVSGVTAHKKEDFFKNTILPAMRRVKWRHANSLMLRNELVEGGLDNVYYVPNGVNEELFNVRVPVLPNRDNLVVGHVGKKCGSGTDAKGHKRFIEPACEQAGVIYRGHYNNYKTRTPHEKMPDFYQEIDLFIVSSETDGTPNGALEAAACGRPILSNKIGNMPEFIKDGYNGFIIPRKLPAYIEKLKWFKENRNALREMGKNARKEVEANWTWKIMSENYRKMFREIINDIGLR